MFANVIAVNKYKKQGRGGAGSNSTNLVEDDYINQLAKAFTERWIDKYNNKGKRGGAYSSGFYDTKPYLLLNFESDDELEFYVKDIGYQTIRV